MRILTHCCTWSLLVALTSCSEVFADFERIQLGNQQYCIPKEYSPYQYGTTSRVFSFAGADTDNRPASLIVQFQGVEVQSHIPEYTAALGEQDFLLFATIRRPGAAQAKNFLTQGAYSSGLTLRDDYQFVEYDTKQGYYKVSQLPFPDTPFWHLYKMKPAVAQPVPELLNDYFLGACSISTIYQTVCNIDIQLHDYLIQIRTPEPNILLQQQLATFAYNKLQQWQDNCPSE
ncbi:hypothetical protein Q3O60_07660 [Alkalimonas collagenimarina]|uniref:DUF4136 domain-containing protein n=1 Tax=Alkalimonas collagenimarina TaxID=400390 RepID=A0ABT9GYC4_9GAMM|nr:hypothetical protein [Alkalimonas collagenimarina]MDP4536058.1 hypothetical protein [Alkalimonas collagenimarina]